jgi:hypothetical protein
MKHTSFILHELRESMHELLPNKQYTVHTAIITLHT